MSSQPSAPTDAPKKKHSPLALAALIAAVIGFIFACIPGALIVGWILLPIAFVLSIVALCMKGRKNLGVLALILSIVGTIIGVIVFFTVVANAVDDAFSGDDTSVDKPAASVPTDADDEAAGDDDAEEGTRENPYPLGSTISTDDWQVTINSVTFDADDAVANENPFNDAAPEGQEYILVNATVAYTGEESSTPWTSIDYVTADGVTINGHDAMVVAPDALDTMTELYAGGTVEGNEALAVPSDTAEDGVLAVTIDMLGDPVFVAVK